MWLPRDVWHCCYEGRSFAWGLVCAWSLSDAGLGMGWSLSGAVLGSGWSLSDAGLVSLWCSLGLAKKYLNHVEMNEAFNVLWLRSMTCLCCLLVLSGF